MRPLSRWLPVLVWAGLIFAMSSLPGVSSGLGTWDLVLKKCAHAAGYAVLAVLLLRALGRELPAFVLAVLYAVSDEVHQTFVAGRHGSPRDVLIDAVGAALGLLVAVRARASLRTRV
ncbi:MAG TPA: VanZ family protein [Gaiellaceae bacterium]|jgi:VanZ family protein